MACWLVAVYRSLQQLSMGTVTHVIWIVGFVPVNESGISRDFAGKVFGRLTLFIFALIFPHLTPADVVWA